MTPDQILRHVAGAIGQLIDAAEPYHGLIPSMIDRDTRGMIHGMPPAIPGQRDGDRAYLGSNLIHDEALLLTMFALAQTLDRQDFAQAADVYLQRFATHCANTATGLFPWGEHAYWHLAEDRLGNSYADAAGRPDIKATHDQLRQPPRWLWDKLWTLRSESIERFAHGLDWHWIDDARTEYIRHAYIEEKQRHAMQKRSCDFPRHGGFYIFVWAYALAKTGREEFRQQMRRMLDYWWRMRDARGLLRIESRSPPEDTRFFNVNAPGQTLSLGVSLLEAAALLEGGEEGDAELAQQMTQRGHAYIDGFLAAPHDLEKGVFVLLSHREDQRVIEAMPVWGSRYGVWPASYVALTALCAYRLTHDARLLRWAEAVGQRYATTAMPEDTAAPAMDAGLGLGLLADLYDLTGDLPWRERGLDLAARLVERYMDGGGNIPRGALGIDWYESQMGPSFLLHGLARMALLTRDREHCPLAADYTAR